MNYTDDKGKEKSENENLKLPPDLANGMVLTMLKNFQTIHEDLSYVVATPKPRIVKLEASPRGSEPFTILGSRREALHFAIKVDIGDLAGLMAPFLGKQPPDNHVWISRGDAPTFVKSVTLSYMAGPIWRTELASPVWPQKGRKKRTKKVRKNSKSRKMRGRNDRSTSFISALPVFLRHSLCCLNSSDFPRGMLKVFHSLDRKCLARNTIWPMCCA